MSLPQYQRPYSMQPMAKPCLRRLPTVPTVEVDSARPQSQFGAASRPLPPIPRILACKQCKSHITCISMLLPLSKIPPQSRAFRGFNGKASLFTQVQHVNFSRPAVHLMNTGAHTMQEISCSKCRSYLGWHIVRAHVESEEWKESNFLLELENLSARLGGGNRQPIGPLARRRRTMSSDSEDSSLSS